MSILRLVATFFASLFKSRRQLVLENLALTQQVAMLRQSMKRPGATPADKLFWIFFSRYVDGWRTTLQLALANPYVERVIGSIRRECLDHVIVLNERHLRKILRDYVDYYHTSRTHLSSNKDPPDPRTVESVEHGNIVALPRVGGFTIVTRG